jgi:hypothetical protein
MMWARLLTDVQISPQFDDLHARIDNYQIYSIAWCDHDVTTQTTNYDNGISLDPESILTSRIASFNELPNNSAIIDSPSRGLNLKYYSRLTPYVPGVSYSYLETIGLQYRGQDDPNRTIARILPSQSIVDFDPNGWSLDGEYSLPDLPYSHQFQTVVEVSFAYGYSSEENVGNRPPSSTVHPATTSNKKSEGCIAFQSFDIHRKIEQNFSRFIQDYPIRIYPINKANYLNLVSGLSYDKRLWPDEIVFTSSFTGNITYSFYRENIYEPHPKVSHSLDYVHRRLQVETGRTYKIDIANIVLGTLLTDSSIFLAAVASYSKTNQIPTKYLLVSEVPSLMQFWDSLFPPIPPIDNSFNANNFTLTSHNVLPGGIVRERTITTATPTPVVLAANNNYWGFGSNVIDINKPPQTHPLFDFDYISLFETLQPDNSYGTYTMNSILLIEAAAKIETIYKALDAGTYATYTDENGQELPRVTNIGWYMEKMANILGLRRKPNGKYLDAVDQAKYDRTRLNSPKWELGDYDLNSWGNKGYALRHLPTTYEGGQRQDNQYDLVHDLPQLLAAILDQIDLGQGLQHTAAIRLKVGKDVQSYQNVGQLTIDLAARVIEMEALVQKMAVMQIETSNSVRELFPGIGIPVATKSVSIDIGGKQQRIFYPGFQSGKGSILDNLSAIKVNLGIALGQLMPQKKPDSRWNPFDRKPKS